MTDATALLPDRLPEIHGVELAAAHLPGPEPCWDWYDAIPLPGDTVGIAIADVTGRGAPAAALQLDNPRWPHLDLKLLPRQLALASSDVRVFERTSDMLRFLKALPAALSPDRGSTGVQDLNRSLNR